MDSILSFLSVDNLSLYFAPSPQFSTDPTGAVANNLLLAAPDLRGAVANVNIDGLFNNSPSSIVSGYYRPGNQELLGHGSDLTAIAGQYGAGFSPIGGALIFAPLFDAANEASTFINTDPLILDLTGAGIQLSNWIDNAIYFGTNVNALGQADGKLHHTSWVNPSSGILAFDANGNGKIDNITETLSEFFRASSYTTGFSALASLANTGATAFTAATSKIDLATGKSYFSELVAWSDTNQDGVSQASELKTLAQLGITSISLTPGANVGESINGSAVTSRAYYTTAAGNFQIASVDLQTDTTADITVTASGGTVVNSTPEGGASASNSFVAQNASGHNYSLSNGTLVDATTGVTVSSSIKAVFASTQNDAITVSASDTNSYWLGGGTGAATLTGGAGNTVFFINARTVVHGGTGFNIAQVVDAAPITIDLGQSRLQEVIGGVGDGIFNASGTSWNVFIQGGSGNNIIVGGAANAALTGGTGDDVIKAGTGGSVIHAGSGTDVIYGGSGSSSASAPPRYVNAAGATNQAFVERLYIAGLGREADQAGFSSWVGQLGSGTSQTSVATSFVNSSEWATHYGTQTNTQFVTSIFTNFLGRVPQASELNSFVTALNNGSATRGSELAQIAADPQSQAYVGSLHSGASDVIYGGSGNSTVLLGTNNSIVYAGQGKMTVVGKAGYFSVIGLHGSYADYSLTTNADGSKTITDHVAGRDGAVTFKDVSAFDFADLTQVSLTNALGMPVNDKLTIGNTAQVQTSGSNFIIQNATLLTNDIDYAGKTLSIREIVDNAGVGHGAGSAATVNGGVATLNSNGTITFAPTAGFTGIYNFRYHVVDGSGQNGETVNQIGTSNFAEQTATVYLNQAGQPTDPLVDDQWFMQAANVLAAQKDYTGKGVSIGVFDPSGNVDFNNLDLASNAGYAIKVDGSTGIDHIGTHATLVAGVIAAAANGAGAIGVAPDATISSEALGISVGADIANIVDWKNYDVVNNSWGDSRLFLDNGIALPGFAQAYSQAAIYGRGGLGTAIVFAGGNNRAGGDNTNYHNESNSRYAITVGGINAPSDLGSLQISGAPFSNPGASILVSAPANNIVSTGVTLTNAYGQQFGADYQTTKGTSFATPIVSGIVALMLEANPELGYRDIQKILAYSAVKVDPTDASWMTNAAADWNGGGLHTSENYGFGEVDARTAVRLAETWDRQDIATNEADIRNLAGLTSKTPTGTSLNAALVADQGVGSTPYYAVTVGGTNAIQVEHADLELNLVGVNPNDLVVRLISPSGVVSTLVNAPPSTLNPVGQSGAQNLDFTFDSVRDFGESSVGAWKFQVATASGAPVAGTIAGYSLDLYGRNPNDGYSFDAGSTYIYTDEFASLGSAPSRQTLSDSSGAIDSINVAAVSGPVTINLNQGGVNSIAGHNVTIASGTHIDRVNLGDGAATVTANNDGDSIFGGRGSAIIHGGTGPDTFYANIGALTITGNGAASLAANADYLSFQYYLKAGITANLATGVLGGAASGMVTGVPNVIGSSYDDSIIGSAVANYLDGNGGNDTLTGGAGDDIYVYNAGYGNDSIVEAASGGNDTLYLGTGLTASSLIFTRAADNPNDDIITFNGRAGSIRLVNQFAGNGAGIEGIHFSDGTSWSSATLAQYTNTAPVIATGGTVTGAFTEIAGVTGSTTADTANGNIKFTDIDTGNTHSALVASVTISGITSGLPSNTAMLAFLTTLGLTEQAGATPGSVNWAFSSADKTFDYLGAGQTATLTYAVQIKDNVGAYVYQNVAVTVTGANDAPIITSNGGGATAAVSMAENSTAVTTVVGSDPDIGTNLAYAISGGTDAAQFQINATTGALSFKTAPNFEAPTDTDHNNIYGVTVRVSDGSLFHDQAISVTVTDVLDTGSYTGTAAADTFKAPNAFDWTISGLAGNDKLTGNAGHDVLYGGDGNDTLDGGTNSDTLYGGLGNDIYIVDNAGDQVIENDNEGTDTVKSSISYSLPANVEKLTLTGSANIDGTGNILANTLTGNASDNHLFGLDGKDILSGGAGNDVLSGGFGADKLTGGAGSDTFLFDVMETSANKDTIADFVSGTDKIAFDHLVFGALGSAAGPLSASQFVIGTAATTAQQHLLYDGSTGALYYDPDGIGGVAQIEIALLTGHPALAASDFMLI